ncbi:hypothetical protein PR202_ga06270 [Eleusine coracana subsp. coracana]|uniref:Peptidase M14 domain-containing protein n=1 Tax=Eleusine coracana subsp. coracana TaxID=191504 RepID=A0AAV5BUD8_ELECO|nr:hypothetical protein PR202_ga06270 [Eleusine coracana subsp. coracana]
MRDLRLRICKMGARGALMHLDPSLATCFAGSGTADRQRHSALLPGRPGSLQVPADLSKERLWRSLRKWWHETGHKKSSSLSGQRPPWLHTMQKSRLDFSYQIRDSSSKEYHKINCDHTQVSKKMDTLQASNKGYSAKLFVVTFNQVKRVQIMAQRFMFFGFYIDGLVQIDLDAGRGVDLNRNWSVDWGKKEKDYDPYEENPGSAPFSEPEAQIMRDLSSSFKPHIWVNVHSGMEALFMPYDHKNTTPNGASAHLMRYFAHGTTTDYMYGIGKVPMPYTFEIYGDETASNSDCFKMFNPVDKTTFERVINRWCMAFLILFEEGLRNLRDAQLVSQGPIDNWVPIGGDIVEKNVARKIGRERRKLEGLDLGMQELRTYFRLFMLSTFLLMFMFCSRISNSRQGNIFNT